LDRNPFGNARRDKGERKAGHNLKKAKTHKIVRVTVDILLCFFRMKRSYDEVDGVMFLLLLVALQASTILVPRRFPIQSNSRRTKKSDDDTYCTSYGKEICL
jgi:hypothetical protein